MCNIREKKNNIEIMQESLDDATVLLERDRHKGLRSSPEAVCIIALGLYLGRINKSTDQEFKEKLTKVLNEVTKEKSHEG